MTLRIAVLAAAGALLAGGALAQAQAPKADIGRQEYLANCAACHGAAGKGDGPFVKHLKQAPPDLSTLAKRNGGVFPFARVIYTIDGDAAHGSREMPLWSRTFRAEQLSSRYDEPAGDPQPAVRARLMALAEYLERLQPK